MNFTNLLGRAALNLESHYVISGEFPLPDFRISFMGPKKKKLRFPYALSSNQTAIESICSHASITVLGQKGETIIDENVRRSKEILPDKISFQDGINLLHHKNCDDILELVRQALVPDCNKVVAELEKMDIYREKCHLKSHYDPPRGDGYFGKLVLVLPSLHVGGELEVEKPGDSKQSFTTAFSKTMIPGGEFSREKNAFDLLNKSKKRTCLSSVTATLAQAQAQEQLKSVVPKGIIQWVAFFGDCKHQVQTIQFGTRFSLSYWLRRTDSATATVPLPLSSKDEIILLQRAQNFQKILINALRDKNFCFQGVELGFACIHLYEDQELPNSHLGGKTSTVAQALNLKGADALVCFAAAQLGLSVTVIQLERTDCASKWSMKKIPDAALIKKLRRMGYWKDAGSRARLTDAKDVYNDLSRARDPIRDVEWCVTLPGLASDDILHPLEPTTKPLMARTSKDIVYNTNSYHGDYTSTTKFYTHAAILLHIPAFEERLNLKICSAANDSTRLQTNDSQVHFEGLKSAIQSHTEKVLSFQHMAPGKQDISSISTGDFHCDEDSEDDSEDLDFYETMSDYGDYSEEGSSDEEDDGSLLSMHYSSWPFIYNKYDSYSYDDEDDEDRSDFYDEMDTDDDSIDINDEMDCYDDDSSDCYDEMDDEEKESDIFYDEMDDVEDGYESSNSLGIANYHSTRIAHLQSTDYHSMTVVELKSECRSAGLKVGGKKAELISRLQENSTKRVVRRLF
jgi:hypothetical protein